MKKLIVLMAAVCLATAGAEAQNWLDAAKKVATDVLDSATGGKLTEVAIIGTWNYKSPASRLDGGDILSSAGGALVGSTVNSKLTSIFEKVGVREGFCSITFNSDGTFVMPVKSKKLEGTYEFNPSTHAITLNTGKLGSFTGYAYINGTELEIVFPVNKLVDFMKTLGSKVSALSSVTSMLDKFENANLGFAFSK